MKTNRFRAPRVRRIPGQMNKLEAAYYAHLQALKDAGEIVKFGFEVFRLKLAEKTYYTPDFSVLLPNGEYQFHETKGGLWQDDARVKIKVVAEMYPEFGFVAVTRRSKRDGGGWLYEHFAADPAQSE